MLINIPDVVTDNVVGGVEVVTDGPVVWVVPVVDSAIRYIHFYTYTTKVKSWGGVAVDTNGPVVCVLPVADWATRYILYYKTVASYSKNARLKFSFKLLNLYTVILFFIFHVCS